MVIDSIRDGIVIDHIKAGLGLEIYRLLKLGKLDCQVAIIQHATSQKGNKKDVIKIDSPIEIDLDVLGYLDPGCTVNVIRDSKVAEKYHPAIPETLTGVISCKNPRCITSAESDLPHVFRLTDKDAQVYRCIYCETMAKKIKI
ncbi:MAG: aspartate carbamoyltransferase regulatory subunit [Oscillospiraceae bacterium]|nr:aspartate carbamoyltransferase regulatory subunit [Oscillospiraceae bacterium]